MMEWLTKYEFLTSWILLPVECLFLGLMLWEFKYIRNEQREIREKEIVKKVKHFVWCIANDFKQSYKVLLDKCEYKTLKSILYCDGITIEQFCKERAEKYRLPLSFYKKVLTSSIKNLTEQWQESETINYTIIYDYFIGWANRIFTAEVLHPALIKNRNQYFKSDKEIEEIYDFLIRQKYANQENNNIKL